MKNGIRRFNKVYFELFRKSRLLTQIFAFPTAVIIFLNFFKLLYFTNTYDGEMSPEFWTILKADLIGLVVTGTLFAARFLLSFSIRETLFWISQLVWLATLLMIYWQLPSSDSNVCVEFWLSSYGQFAKFSLLAYLLFSPLRQMLTLTISIGCAFNRSENLK